ncbi:MAG: D-alanyl-D-alanine carboxypeptidase/D-alanyl-D-alanine-endopeptidase, partial [Pseudomonadota bacterium]
MRWTFLGGLIAATGLLTAGILGFAVAAEFKSAPERARIPAPRPDPGLPQARSSLDLRTDFKLTGVSGWLAVDLKTGQVLDQHLAGEGFAPASVAKLPTAFFALDRLGPQYRFETRVAVTGEVRAERLEGDLILIGGGDPELDNDALLPLVTQTRELGFRTVAGAFLVDGSAAPNFSAIDPAQPAEAPYNPGLSGLNLNFNRVRLKWGQPGIEVFAWARRLQPPAETVRVVPAAAAGAPLFTHAFDGREELWRMSQRALRRKGERWLPVKAPALYSGAVFRGLAETYGMSLDRPRQAAVSGAQVVARHQSRPLSSMLRDMLKYSTNITAEAVGAAASGADEQAFSAAAMNAWAADLAGFAPGDPGFAFVNHSGLTTASRVSPERMVALLRALAMRPGGTHARLPGVAAGYLKPHNVAAETMPLDYDHLDVVSKTGTMNYIRGLSGYVATPGGRQLAFAIFSNDLPRRTRGEGLDRRWMGRARGFERALIRNWVLMTDGSRRSQKRVAAPRALRHTLTDRVCNSSFRFSRQRPDDRNP